MNGNFLAFFVCAVMPVAIVLIVSFASMNKDKLRAQVLMKAIESKSDFDAEKLAEALQKPKKTPLETLHNRLLCGCIFTLAGVFCGVIFLIYSNCMPSSLAIPLLLLATCWIAIGLGFLITYLVTRKQVQALSEKENRSEEEVE